MANLNRIFKKLSAAYDSSDYYETQQITRTICSRFVAKKSYIEAIDLLFSCSCYLLTEGQIEGGFDLAKLLVEILFNNEMPIEDCIVDYLVDLMTLMQGHNEERSEFIAASIRYANLCDRPTYTCNQPSHTLHSLFAMQFWEEKDYPNSRYHFTHSDDHLNLSGLLIEMQTQLGRPEEFEMFILQTTLQLLCLRKQQMAQKTFDLYVANHPYLKRMPDKPLIHFIEMMFTSLEKNSSYMYTLIMSKYKDLLSVDLSYESYLIHIGSLYFNIVHKKSFNPFRNMFNSLFADDEDEDNKSANAKQEPSISQKTPPTTLNEPLKKLCIKDDFELD